MRRNKLDSKEIAKSIRINLLKMVNKGKSSHIGSVLSIADILSVLYCDVLNYSPSNPKFELRDRFVLSKGHAGAGLYAILAECGFFNQEKLFDHYQNGSKMSGHVSHYVEGVEVSTGSLGTGLGVSCGIALALKLQNKTSKVFCLLSDGELNEGSTWEAIMFSAHHSLNNLFFIIDKNNLQSIKSTSKTLNMGDLRKKFLSFNINTLECDGHNHTELKKSLLSFHESKPTALISNTIKGKGVKFMENNVLWHYKSPNDEELHAAIRDVQNA